MRIVNLSAARTGASGPYCIDLQEEFWSDPARHDVIDAPQWIATGSHVARPLHKADGGGYSISGETLRILFTLAV
jgi:hypothetical protein